MAVFSTLINVADLKANLNESDLIVVDCRYSLTQPDLGRRRYQEGHISGAIYAHLDDDLSGDFQPNKTGRHPLPELGFFIKKIESWGIGNDSQVVAYDDTGGAIAARLWWMLRWLGHDAVAVLDGGWVHWRNKGYPVETSTEERIANSFSANPNYQMIVESDEMELLVESPHSMIIDSRSADRYRGENETIDPIAGHIQGALSAPYQDNLTSRGTFRDRSELCKRFLALFEGNPADDAVFYCGSGVTAAHNLLAMVHAGFDIGRLYVGSWSEWITDPMRPISTGSETR